MQRRHASPRGAPSFTRRRARARSADRLLRAAAGLGVAAASLLGATGASADDVTARLDAQDREIARLREEIARERRDREAEAKRPPPITVGGYAQVDWVAYRESSQDELSAGTTRQPLNSERFLLRRSRIRVVSERSIFHGVLELDANTVQGLQVRPINAEASIKWPTSHRYPTPATSSFGSSKEPYIIVTAGLFRTPFGFAVVEGSRERTFFERSTFASALFPGSFDLGLRVLGGYKLLNYALGIVNGAPIGERAFPGRDPNKSKDVVMRVGTSTDVVGGVRLDVGVSGLTGRGFHAGDAGTKADVTWRDANGDAVVQPSEIVGVPGTPGAPSGSFLRYALGAHARVVVAVPVLGSLQLRGEVVRGRNLDRGLVLADPVAAGRNLTELGWAVGATQELTHWAAAAVRYDEYRPDVNAPSPPPGAAQTDVAFSTWTFSGGVRLDRSRLVGEFAHRDNATGVSPAGVPQALADDSFTMRAEVGF